MNPLFEELDFRDTSMGELALRRRRVMALKGKIIYEVKLNDEYLMSSLFYAAEAAPAETALAGLSGSGWDVAVGGLGLGYTAAAALEFEQVRRLVVIEALAPVIDWHRQHLVPNGAVFDQMEGLTIYFDNPLQQTVSENGIYLAHRWTA